MIVRTDTDLLDSQGNTLATVYDDDGTQLEVLSLPYTDDAAAWDALADLELASVGYRRVSGWTRPAVAHVIEATVVPSWAIRFGVADWPVCNANPDWRAHITLDPQARSAWLATRYVGDNATTFAEWHGRAYSLPIPSAATPNEVLAELQEHAADLDTLTREHTVDWYGNNLVGRLTPAGINALDRLEVALAGIEPRYTVWPASEWFVDPPAGVRGGLTDSEIEDLAQELEADAERENVIVHGLRRYLTTLSGSMSVDGLTLDTWLAVAPNGADRWPYTTTVGVVLDGRAGTPAELLLHATLEQLGLILDARVTRLE